MTKQTREVIWDDLISHPFNELALSDREKFHTGFLKYAISKLGNEGFIRSVFKELPEGNVKTELEKDSIDLKILITDRNSGELVDVSIVEVKVKATLRKNQLQDYVAKVQKKYGLDRKPRSYLVTLLPPDDDVVLPRRCKKIGFVDEVAEALGPALRSNKKLQKEARLLLDMWLQYLRLLKPVRDAIESRRVMSLEPFGCQLDKARLRSIFERRRLYLLSQKVDPGKMKAKLGNTHGNALIDYYREVGGKISYGLQWQSGLLKFFIAVPQSRRKSIGSRRDEVLLGLATTAQKTASDLYDMGKFETATLNHSGAFRSVTLESDWDVWKDCRRPIKRLKNWIEIISEESYQRKVEKLKRH